MKLGASNVALFRFTISLNSFKLTCCIGWLLIWLFKVYYREILYYKDWRISSIVMISLEIILIALTVLSVTTNLKVQQSLTDDTVFNPNPSVRFHPLAKFSLMTQYLDAFVCLLLIFACLQVLNIFVTTRWVLSVLSNALSQMFVLYTLFSVFFGTLAVTTNLAYGDTVEELSTLEGALFNQFQQFLGSWNTPDFEKRDRVVLYIYVLISMIFYFYFFWPFQITLVINSMASVIKT